MLVLLGEHTIVGFFSLFSTYFIYGYMVKNHSDSEQVNQMQLLHRLLIPIICKGSFVCIIPQT